MIPLRHSGSATRRAPLSDSAASNVPQGSPTGWRIAAAVILLVLAIAALPLLTGYSQPRWDAVDLFEPSFALVGDSIRSGHFLKWDPWSGGGAPDWTQPELGTTSPVLIAFAAVFSKPEIGYLAYWLSVWAFGGLGMLLLARHAGCSPAGGVIAACGFAASGFYTGHAEHLTSLYSLSFVPWVLWRFDAGLDKMDWKRGIEAGGLYGLSALGGYPEFTILTPGFLALWGGARLLSRDARMSGPRRSLSATALWLSTIAIGALIFCMPYAGLVLSTHGYTDYIGPRARDVAISSNLLPAGALTTFASPYLANLNLPPNPVWPATDEPMTSVYTGAACLTLALFALRREKWRWAVAAIALFFLACALGNQLPVRGWLYDFAPPTRYFRNPSLFRPYALLLIGYLSALGARDLARLGISARLGFPRLRFLGLAIATACAALTAFAVVSHGAGKSAPWERLGIAHVAVVWLGLAALAWLLYSGSVSASRFLALAAALACLDAIGAVYISATVSEPVQPWYTEPNKNHSAAMDLTSSGLSRSLAPPEALGPGINNRNLLIKLPVLDNYTSRQDLRNRFLVQIVADPRLNRMALGADRMWFTAAADWQAPDDAAFGLWQRRMADSPGAPVIFLHSPRQMLALAPQGASPERLTLPAESPQAGIAIPADITHLAYQPDVLSFQYDAPSPGYLVVTDRWADGWQVNVNGQPRAVLGADFLYRAVQVDSGKNVIRFVYAPRGFLPLFALSWFTLLLAAAWQVRNLLLRFRHASHV